MIVGRGMVIIASLLISLAMGYWAATETQSVREDRNVGWRELSQKYRILGVGFGLGIWGFLMIPWMIDGLPVLLDAHRVEGAAKTPRLFARQ